MNKLDRVHKMAKAFMTISIGLFFLSMVIYIMTYWFDTIELINLTS